MLVCSVVLRAKRGTLGAAVAESADASDAYSIGAVFAIIADVPGTASDYLDGFVGKRMVEPANAVDVVDAASLRNAAIVEETNAGATFIASVSGAGVTVVYGAVLDGTFVDPLPPATLLGTDVLDSGPITVFEP